MASISDIEAQVAKALAGIVAAVGQEDKKDDDAPVWIGSSVKNFPGGQGVTERDVMKKSDMQQKVLSAGARRLPSYFELAEKLVRSEFMSESSAKYPGGVASGLGNAIDVYQAYSADGGTMNFTQWLDWYSSGGTGEMGGDGGRKGGAGGYSGPTTTTSVTVTDEVTAEALLDRFARDLLGRGLTKKETDKYLREFRQAEMGAPQVTTTSRGVGSATQLTETAASKDEMLRQIISQNPDYQKFQIDTTIMDMLMEDIEKGKKAIYG